MSIEEKLTRHFGIEALKKNPDFRSEHERSEHPTTDEGVQELSSTVSTTTIRQKFSNYNAYTIMASNLNRMVQRIDGRHLNFQEDKLGNVKFTKKFSEMLKESRFLLNGLNGVTFVSPVDSDITKVLEYYGALGIGNTNFSKNLTSEEKLDGILFVANKWVSFAAIDNDKTDTLIRAQTHRLPTLTFQLVVFPVPRTLTYVAQSVDDLAYLRLDRDCVDDSARGTGTVQLKTKEVIVALGNDNSLLSDRYLFELGNALEEYEYSVTFYVGRKKLKGNESSALKNGLKDEQFRINFFKKVTKVKDNSSKKKFELPKAEKYSLVITTIGYGEIYSGLSHMTIPIPNIENRSIQIIVSPEGNHTLLKSFTDILLSTAVTNRVNRNLTLY